jgi:signal transduction histidine kinase
MIAIASCLNSMRQRDDADGPPPEVDHVDRLLDTGLAMVHELLMAGERRSPAAWVDVNRLLEEVDGIVSSIVGSDVTVRTSLGAGESRVYARRADLERILLNVVFNAAAAMPSGGALLIETSTTPAMTEECRTAAAGTLRVTIRDTGRGMSDDQRRTAINPYARPRPDGTGLGLACVAAIIQRLGGTMAIDSAKGSGTVVSIALPLSPPSQQQIH